MHDEILTAEKAANKLATRLAHRPVPATVIVDGFLREPPQERLSTLADEIVSLVIVTGDLEDRLLLLLELGKLSARSPLHGGRVFLNGKQAHKGLLVSLNEAQQALHEHDQITFTCAAPAADREPEPTEAASGLSPEPAQPEQDTSIDDSYAPPKKEAAPRPVMTKKMAEIFPPPNGIKPENWAKTLSDPPAWIKDARISSGKPGVSALWNPALFAVCMVSKRNIGKIAARTIIQREFPDWVSEWEALAVHL